MVRVYLLITRPRLGATTLRARGVYRCAWRTRCHLSAFLDESVSSLCKTLAPRARYTDACAHRAGGSRHSSGRLAGCFDDSAVTWRACNAENLMPLGNHAAPWDEPKRPPMCVRRKAFLLSRHKERVGGVGNPGYCVVGFPEGRDDPSFSQTCDIKERPREGGQDPSSLQLSLD